MRSHYQTIRSLQAGVLLITFGAGFLARAWLAETRAPFPLLLDPQREAYRAYGLERSLLRSWGLKNLGYYDRALLGGRRWHGIQGDSSQLGGDFVVDRRGLIRLAYPSHDPTDRPSLPQLLAALAA